jgi:hypothetical protein
MWNLAFLVLGIVTGIFLALDYKMLEIGKYGHRKTRLDYHSVTISGIWLKDLDLHHKYADLKVKFKSEIFIPNKTEVEKFSIDMRR